MKTECFAKCTDTKQIEKNVTEKTERIQSFYD